MGAISGTERGVVRISFFTCATVLGKKSGVAQVPVPRCVTILGKNQVLRREFSVSAQRFGPEVASAAAFWKAARPSSMKGARGTPNVSLVRRCDFARGIAVFAIRIKSDRRSFLSKRQIRISRSL